MPTPQAPQQQTPRGQQQNQNATTPAPQGGGGGAGGGAQAPVPPAAPGGGALTNSLFSGDHVLETVAAGTSTLKEGARGPSARAVQNFLIGQGLQVGRAGADGAWGGDTSKAVKQWQSSHGLNPDGVIGKDTLAAMDKSAPVAAAPTGPAASTPQPGAGPAPGAQAQRPSPPTTQPEGAQNAGSGGGNAPAGGAPGSQNGGLPGDFQKMWDAHPHNYQKDGTQNTASSDLLVKQGWDPDQYSNTCAIRLSIMFNQLGGNLKITREKAKAAGLDPARIPFSKKTGWYYILSAKEMWTYLSRYAGPPHQQWPTRGRYKTSAEFEGKIDEEIKPVVSGKKGIVAFDKIFGFSGTGHVDIFDGLKLSDAPDFYPCESLKVWYM
ncbi:MAG: hypothetical protein EXR79_11695 [Myxococcales bacterium]|nr:hypothetical protein [Myxococcales bacterium]